MSVKEFFIDLWLTIRYGRWEVSREHMYSVEGWTYRYLAKNPRTGERIYCLTKRIAEGASAAQNDLRGTRIPFTD